MGLVGYRFNTIGVSDGISMGTDGMSFSLQVRVRVRSTRDA
jgi:dihydroxy-acid dehydratase